MTPPAPILRLADIRRSDNIGPEVETEVLHGISLSLQPAEFVALKGPSGSGKSTLRNIIDLLESPTPVAQPCERRLHARCTSSDHCKAGQSLHI